MNQWSIKVPAIYWLLYFAVHRWYQERVIPYTLRPFLHAISSYPMIIISLSLHHVQIALKRKTLITLHSTLRLHFVSCKKKFFLGFQRIFMRSKIIDFRSDHDLCSKEIESVMESLSRDITSMYHSKWVYSLSRLVRRNSRWRSGSSSVTEWPWWSRNDPGDLGTISAVRQLETAASRRIIGAWVSDEIFSAKGCNIYHELESFWINVDVPVMIAEMLVSTYSSMSTRCSCFISMCHFFRGEWRGEVVTNCCRRWTVPGSKVSWYFTAL